VWPNNKTHIYKRGKSLQHNQSLTRTFKKSTKWSIHARSIFPELMPTSLTTTHAKVLVTIKGKEFEQYLPPMKSDMNTRNSTKLCHFHHDHSYDTEECHALEKKDIKIDLQGIHPIMCKERNVTWNNMEIFNDALPKIW